MLLAAARGRAGMVYVNHAVPGELMREPSAPVPVFVTTHSGYKADEYPRLFRTDDWTREVIDIEDRWYDPSYACFRVFADDARRYLLKRRFDDGQWEAIQL